MAANPNLDAIRFDSQRLNWTLREFDRYSAAFAFGLLEAGFVRGDKLVMYTDQTAAAESLVAQMGAIKAGVTMVSFAEKDNQDALDHALRTTKAKGLMLTPSSSVNENSTRKTFLQSLMPELNTMYAGDDLALAKYPNLQHII